MCWPNHWFYRLVDYHNRKTGIDLGVGGEIVKSLSEFERKLVEEQDVIEIRGKVSNFYMHM